MTRRIETEAGTIVGTVDRVERRVDWHLECPDCQTLLLFSDDAFHGRAGGMDCACGFTLKPLGIKDRSENGTVYSYYNFADAASAEQSSGVEPGGLHREMSL